MDIIETAAAAGIRKAKQNPVIYRLWYLLYRRNTGVRIQWFNAGTALYVDGYPRSGNTFAQFLIKNLWPAVEFVHHFHAIAPLKIALKRNIPTFVLFRYPAAAISSNYIKTFAMRGCSSPLQIQTDLRFLRELTKSYADYYQFVSENTDYLKLIDFEMLISDPDNVMLSINQEISEQLQLQRHAIIRRVNEIKDREFGARDPLGSSKPSPDKEHAKDTLIDAVGQFKEYDICLKLHESLKETSRAQHASNSCSEGLGDC